MEDIAAADYRSVSDVNCIYVETVQDPEGYTQRYWVKMCIRDSPKEVKEELHEELEELKEHGHHGHHPADKPEDDGKTAVSYTHLIIFIFKCTISFL